VTGPVIYPWINDKGLDKVTRWSKAPGAACRWPRHTIFRANLTDMNDPPSHYLDSGVFFDQDIFLVTLSNMLPHFVFRHIIYMNLTDKRINC